MTRWHGDPRTIDESGVHSVNATPVRLGAVLREAIAVAIATPVASVLTVAVVAGMCIAVLMTAGRTFAAEEAVLRSIDSAGSRSIIVRAEPSAGLDSTIIGPITNMDGVEWVGGFSPSTDAQNAAFSGGNWVPLRIAYGPDMTVLGLPDSPLQQTPSTFASAAALEQLGLLYPAGVVQARDGAVHAVTGTADVPDYIEFLEPLLITRGPSSSDASPEPMTVLVVVATRPNLVAVVATAVRSLLITDPTKISIETSEEIAALRAQVEGQLATTGRMITLGILTLSAILSAVIVYGIVTMRRRDYGRRRALGASQHLIVALLLTQTGLLALIGTSLGTLGALLVLVTSGDPLPHAPYVIAVATLAVATGLASSLLPAISAARREPLHELRIP